MNMNLSWMRDAIKWTVLWLITVLIIFNSVVFLSQGSHAAQRERDAFIKKLEEMEGEQMLHPTAYVPGVIRDMRQWVIERGRQAKDAAEECGK